ncbi:MAG: methyltransferase domain-containing protein [Polyangiaceae bacterium]|nr:methyltransferase domain-containing protein [Polyangiaceae bacterium]
MTQLQAAVPAEPSVDRLAVDETLRDYLGHFEPKDGHDPRTTQYTTMVNQYYDLVTDFYERGWGKSFHFAPRFEGESFKDSIVRHEHYLALRLELKPGAKVLDIGCGVGGPMREIARFSGASIDGINNNGNQLAKLRQYNREARLDSRCRGIKADFMALPLEDGSYDAAYAIESTCHAPDKTKVFGEVLRVLRPGGLFGGYEWCLTDSYDATSELDRSLKHRIEVGDGLPSLVPIPDVRRSLEAAGFEVLEITDLALSGDPETPWYLPLRGEPGLAGLPRRGLGRLLTRRAIAGLESLGVAPKGSSDVSRMLNDAADALVEAGQRGIFTPMLFFVARRPL